MATDDDQGGRVFFSSTGRTLEGEDEIVLLTVGVDIGSSTSHLVFSRIVLERLDSRYVVTERETFYGSDILLTPYSAGETIDAEALGAFIEQEYTDAKVDPDEIDTGALILTGVAVRRSNARAIGELFARQAGKMVAVSAGDSLETIMAAYGSGAVARSIRDECTVMNVDVGGGTSKIAVCADGKVVDLAALDVGARLRLPRARRQDPARRGSRPALRRGARHRRSTVGGMLTLDQGRAVAALMADRLFEAMQGGAPTAQGAGLLRTDPLGHRGADRRDARSPAASRNSSTARESTEVRRSRPAAGGGNPRPRRGVLPDARSAASKASAPPWSAPRSTPSSLSGSTIYVSPLDALPLRNVPVIAPALPLDGEIIDPAAVAARDPGHAEAARSRRRRHAGRAVRAVARLGDVPAARRVLPRRGRRPCATSSRKGHPLILAGDGDVGGLIGIHLREEMKIANAIVSIDGLELKEFDYIDIGAMLRCIRRGAGGDQVADVSGTGTSRP